MMIVEQFKHKKSP